MGNDNTKHKINKITYRNNKKTVVEVNPNAQRARGKSVNTQLTRVIISPPGSMGIGAPKGKPMLTEYIEDTDAYGVYIKDPEILRLQLVMTQKLPQNIKWIFDHDSSTVPATAILSFAVYGSSGLTVKTNNIKLKSYIKKYLKAVKPKDIIYKAIRENICFAESIYFKFYDKETGYIIPKWVDYITLTPVTNKHTGEIKWIQVSHTDPNMLKTNWKNYYPITDYYHSSQYTAKIPNTQPSMAQLFEKDVLRFNLFTSAPIIGTIDLMIWKKWMQYDAKLGGQKYATPIVDAEIDFQSLAYKLTKEEAEDYTDTISESLNRLMNFGVLAHDKAIKLTSIQQQGQVFNYTQYLEYAERLIHKSILVPSNLLESSGAELATSRTTKDMFVSIIKAIQLMFKDGFTDLVEEQLKFANIKFEEGEFELLFSEEDKQQQMTQVEEINGVFGMYDRGMIKDPNEVRAYVEKFGMEFEQLSEEEMTEAQIRVMAEEGNVDNIGDAGLVNQIEDDINAQAGEE